MPRGGYRQGAGRKEGAANRKTREIANAAAETGQTPLEYMLDVMRSPLPPELAELIQQMKAENRLDAEVIGRLVSWHNMRFEAAKGAAPYVHPRLQTTTVKGEGKDGSIPIKGVVELVRPT